MISRLLEDQIYTCLNTIPKVVILLGARQVGKTTLLQSLQERLTHQGKSVRTLNCDLEEERNAVDTTARVLLNRLVEGKDALFIDEVQRLENPGLTLKILADLYPSLMLLATGSSSFELRQKMAETLTGRYVDFLLYLLSIAEVLQYTGVKDDFALRKPTADALLDEILQYGLYPEIYLETNPAVKQLLLSKLVGGYLFKDILSFQRIRYSQTIVDLARALAYQIGNEVNESELANRLKIDRKTVQNYIDILEKSFVITRLYPYSTNLRQEIGKNCKIYFLDIGIRNALIGDFNELNIRSDRGAIWENFIIIERLKTHLNQNRQIKPRFWRSYSGAEVDYIEEVGDRNKKAFEIKMGDRLSKKAAQSFQKSTGSEVQLINQENYLDFIL